MSAPFHDVLVASRQLAPFDSVPQAGHEPTVLASHYYTMPQERGRRDGHGGGCGGLREHDRLIKPSSKCLFSPFGTLLLGERFQWSIECDNVVYIWDGTLTSFEPSPVTGYQTLTFHKTSSCRMEVYHLQTGKETRGHRTYHTIFLQRDCTVARTIRVETCHVRDIQRRMPTDDTYDLLVEWS